MNADMTNGKRKIIQKRVKKRERYARMARIRYRKEKNVPLAKFECLPNPVKLFCSTPHHNFYLVCFSSDLWLFLFFFQINFMKKI